MSKCVHDPYWIGCYGNCMACRAEKAELSAKQWQEMSTISERNKMLVKHELEDKEEECARLRAEVARLQRQIVLDELTQQSQDLGLYDEKPNT